MQPNGRTPPIMMPGKGRVYIDWSGICRGIWFVRVGCSIGCNRTKNQEDLGKPCLKLPLIVTSKWEGVKDGK